MVGRNDPCTCGSGKKYKKCCERSNVVDLRVVINEELDQITNGFVENGLGPREYAELDARIRKWNSELRNIFEPELIEVLAMDSYFYLESGELWTSYLKKQIKKEKRKQIIEVLNGWQHPFLLLGKVTSQKDNKLMVRDELTDESYSILGSNQDLHTGEWLFGIVMPDTRLDARGLFGTNGLVFIPPKNSLLVEQLLEKMKASERDFLEIYRLFSQDEHMFDFTPFQQEVLDLAQQFLAHYKYDQQLIMNLLISFLLDNEVKAKKPSAVASGAIQVGFDVNLIGPSIMTMKEVAEHFNVSTATVAKYRDQVGEFLMDAVASAEPPQTESLSLPSILRDMGTDPRGTEQFMWEMVMRSQQQKFDSVEELNAYMSKKMGEEYKPINDKERAQLLCYQAYNADSVQKRVQLTNKAEVFYPELADVHLLRAEQSDHVVVKENHYLKAIRSSAKQFDDSFEDPGKYVLNRPYLRAHFAYSTWLMTQNRHEEALGYLNRILKMNPSDQQGVRWIIVRVYIQLGLYDEAYQLLDEISSPQEDDAISHYLKMAIEKKETNQKSDIALRKHGEQLNPYVNVMLAEGKNPGAFPRSVMIQQGNQDEAKLIYWLVYGIL